jgi:hypothetical protein
MPESSSKLLGAVIRLATREVATWKALGGASGASEEEGSAPTTSANGVSEARAEAENELEKLEKVKTPDDLSVLMHGAGFASVVFAGIRTLFTGLCDASTLHNASTASFDNSATIAVLTRFQKTASLTINCRDEKYSFREGGHFGTFAISAALPFFKRAKANKDARGARKMEAFIQYFVDEICGKTWGVADVWGDAKWCGDVRSPLVVAAEAGSISLVRAALENARTPSSCVGLAAFISYCKGVPEVFDFLIGTEKCLCSEDRPLVEDCLSFLGRQEGELPALQVQMLESLLRKWPHTLESVWPRGGMCQGALEQAIEQRSEQLVELILRVGGQIRFRKSNEVIGGKSYPSPITLFYALRWPSLPVMKLLLGAGILEDWRAKYDKEALEQVGLGFPGILFSCHPMTPPPGPEQEVLYRSDSLDTLALVLSAGFSYAWYRDPDDRLGNSCFGLFPVYDKRVMAEEHIIDLLSRCKAAGMDILHVEEEDVGKAHRVALAGKAAEAGLNKVLDFAIELQGPESVDDKFETRDASGGFHKSTPLLAAISNQHLTTAHHLLRVHKAKAAYQNVEFSAFEQPIMQALHLKNDDAALPIVKELIKADPSLCDLDCFRRLDSVTPIMYSCAVPLPRCLEALPTSPA